MSKTYPTCLTRDYLFRWNLPNSVRESIQNFLDCGEGNYQLYRFGNTIEMESFVGTIDPKNLLLGVGSKTNDENSRGGFSEGLLLSLLIFARENVDMTFINGDKQWVPTFDWNEDYKCETLYIVEEDAEDPVEDGVKIILNLPSRVADEVELNTLQMQDDYAKFETDEGTILLDKEHQGRIYVGGLFVDNFQSEYGFDFPPQCFALDRDRKSLKPWDVKWQVRHLINQMSSDGEIDEDVSDRLVTSMSKGDEAFTALDEYQVSKNKSLITSAEKLYKENYDGDKILTSNYDEAEKLKEAGNKNVVYCNNESFVKLVQKTDSHKVVFGARKEKEEVSVEDLLDNFEKEWQIDMDTDMYEAWRELSEKIKSQI